MKVLSQSINGYLKLFLQRQEEAQSNSLVSTADIDSETVIRLVSDAVTAILTRLQSKFRIILQHIKIVHSFKKYPHFHLNHSHLNHSHIQSLLGSLMSVPIATLTSLLC